MQEWETKVIKGAIDDLKREEARKFAIAYAELPEQYHGYMQSLPQKVVVWGKEVDEELLKELRNTHGWNKISSWNKKTSYTTENPYLGVDGYLAMLHEIHKNSDVSIDLEFVTNIPNKLIVRSIVVVETDKTKKVYTGVSEVSQSTTYNKAKKESVLKFDSEGKPIFDSVEIPASSAIRKALAYMGDGRFATHKTPYGDHPMVVKFREFILKEKADGQPKEKDKTAPKS